MNNKDILKRHDLHIFHKQKKYYKFKENINNYKIFAQLKIHQQMSRQYKGKHSCNPSTS